MHAATEQLKAQKIRQWVEQTIRLAPNVVEALPAEMRARRRLAAVADAMAEVHFPDSEDRAEQAEHRLRFEELFLHQAILASRKRAHRTARPAPRMGKPGELVARWVQSLPFEPIRRPARRL